MEEFHRFEALEKDKRRRILNVAMKEFLKRGYEKASMNNLVEEAGISKGALFYYFKNKKTLYLYLVDYTMSVINGQTMTNKRDYDADFINRLHITMKGNIELIEEYPLVFAFMRRFKAETSDKVTEEIASILSSYSEAIFKDLYANINRSLFKDDIDVDLAIYSIKATLFEQLHEHIRNTSSDKEMVLKKINAYVCHFKQVYYK